MLMSKQQLAETQASDVDPIAILREHSLMDDPTFSSLVQKKRELIAQKAEAEADLERQLAAVRNAALQGQPVTARDVRVAEILGEELAGKPIDRSKIGPLRQSITDLEVAIREVERRIGSARIAASKPICDAIRSGHDAAVVEMCETLIDFANAVAKYRQLAEAANDFESIGLAWSGYLSPSHCHLLGVKPDDPYSGASVFLRECVAAGLFPASQLPPFADLAKVDMRPASARDPRARLASKRGALAKLVKRNRTEQASAAE